jgi:formate-nitrite transporter family protein
VPIAPTPREVYERSASEGERRLSAAPLDVIATGFLAGFTIVFGIIALGITHGLVAESLGEGVGKVAGALAFGIGLVFAIVGRSELFTENFLDPIAATIEKRPRSSWPRVGTLWLGILVFNLVGGAALAFLLTVEGALAGGAPEALAGVASEIVSRETLPSFTNAIAAGALLTLMTYLLQGTNSVTGRMLIAYLVGFFLAIGPFNHVVVTFLHLLIGMRFGADVGWEDVVANFGVSTAGNLIGGVVFVTITQTARAKG